jgi:UDP-N-acetylmuramoyl-tripeptide--D-alanyl-D-alanine ligase
MEPRSLQQVARDCAGTLSGGDPATLVQRVCTDSRSVRTGDLFVALRGERFDGHDFLRDVAGQGAAAAVVDSPAPPDSARLTSVLVDDTRAALGRMAAAYRVQFDPHVIAVGGSNGKTSAKELLAAVLRQQFNTLWSEASFNNDIGVPLTLLRLEQQHEVAVLEVGTNHPGELEPLVRMVQPQIGVITSLGREHLEFFGDMAGVCREEGALAEQLPATGTLYFGADNEWGEAIARRTQATVVRVGFSEACDWRLGEVSLSTEGTQFELTSPGDRHSGAWRVRLLGRHQALNATFAIAIGAKLGLARDQIQQGLDSAKPAPRRMELRTCGPIRVLDDCYNANADSAAAALHTLAALPTKRDRVAVLGDMAELGSHSETAHQEVGRLAAQLNLAQLLVIGKMASVTATAARNAGLHRVLEFANIDALSEAIRRLIRPGDMVLLKASRRARLERVAEALAECGANMD